jgi:hypothetical protein
VRTDSGRGGPFGGHLRQQRHVARAVAYLLGDAFEEGCADPAGVVGADRGIDAEPVRAAVVKRREKLLDESHVRAGDVHRVVAGVDRTGGRTAEVGREPLDVAGLHHPR